MFRQSSELCLIRLHDIPHISHQAQRPFFALTLTCLSTNALALTPPWLSCLVPCTNSLTKFTSSPPTHASCCIYLFYPSCLALSSLVSSCLILPISCPFYPHLSAMHTPSLSPSPLPSLSLSVSPSFSSPCCGGQVWCRARELARV